ncbi:LPXTG cell wall anchor domain-containing protein [Lactococcus petauri]|uniref:LPXTG cell wall anchor domain-containing protein n=1 Tax=Lactococcus petauri TaxID=1940789 RepID=UPI001F586096|nr:LPXTG cell wall anchor domain-containing protein [Lactococcus petauri]
MRFKYNFFRSLVSIIILLSLPTSSFAAEILPPEKTNIVVAILQGDSSPYPPEPVPPRPFIQKVVYTSKVLPQTGATALNFWVIFIGWALLILGLGIYICFYKKRQKGR